MKIEELTIRDIKTICKSTKQKYCSTKKCPLYEHKWCCLGLKNMTEKELEEEIDYTRPRELTYELNKKALEIIKEKQVDVKKLIDIDFNYEWYVIETTRDKWDKAYILTQEEIDLLKEVLL